MSDALSGSGDPASLDVSLRVADRVEAAFTARPGEVLAVIGPNGAGKSSLVRALAGLVPAEGHARLGGVDLLQVPARDRAVGLVFQGQFLFPHLTALANVAFGPRARGTQRTEAEADARAWLERFGIGELADRRPRQLSGGQAQRVAIARALATKPRLLLLDEPLTGLDVKVAMALRIELGRHLASYDGVTLLVTHDAIDALTIADRVLVLDEGQVAQLGTPAEVSQRPRTEHVARLVGLNVVRRRRAADGVHPRRGRGDAPGARRLAPVPLARTGGRRLAARRRGPASRPRRTGPDRRRDPGRRDRAGPRPGPRRVALGEGHRGAVVRLRRSLTVTMPP